MSDQPPESTPSPYQPPAYSPYAAAPPAGDPPRYAYPAYAPYPAGYVPPTNTMAILSLVFAFVFAPAAIVFGHVAKRQIGRTGEQGDGLATAGLILGYLFTGLAVLLYGFIALVMLAGGLGSSH
jgi:Domain of unknown function (DUF4190)